MKFVVLNVAELIKNVLMLRTAKLRMLTIQFLEICFLMGGFLDGRKIKIKSVRLRVMVIDTYVSWRTAVTSKKATT